jgi:hypothetical protein
MNQSTDERKVEVLASASVPEAKKPSPSFHDRIFYEPASFTHDLARAMDCSYSLVLDSEVNPLFLLDRERLMF